MQHPNELMPANVRWTGILSDSKRVASLLHVRLNNRAEAIRSMELLVDDTDHYTSSF